MTLKRNTIYFYLDKTNSTHSFYFIVLQRPYDMKHYPNWYLIFNINIGQIEYINKNSIFITKAIKIA